MTHYIMKYSNRESTYNHELKHGKFVTVDHNSGGYPWATDNLVGARIWTSLEGAQDYKRIFPFLDIYELNFDLKAVS